MENQNEEIVAFIEKNELQLRKGVLVYAVLQVLKHGPVYSSDILAKLRQANLIVVEGTVYPLLSRLADEKILGYEWQESSSGPPRKYYQLTRSGELALKQISIRMSATIKSIKTLEEGKS